MSPYPLRQTVRRATRRIGARRDASREPVPVVGEFDLHALLAELVAELRPEGETAVHLVLEIYRGTPDVLVDRFDVLRQAVAGLIRNALLFTPLGSVELRCHLVGGSTDRPVVRFQVIDTGTGELPSANKSAAVAHLVARLGGRLHMERKRGIGSRAWFDVKFHRAATAALSVSPVDLAVSAASLPPAPPIPDSRIDLAPLVDLLALSGDSAFAEHLIAGFEADGRALLRQMGSAVEAKDWTALKDHAHAMAGSSTALGLLDVSGVSRRIQKAPDEALKRDASAMFAEMVASFGPALGALRQAVADLLARGGSAGSGP
jgi:HPt (histidine-containing phosphotransfer) domain-containing protein